jgi:hypothetical protein
VSENQIPATTFTVSEDRKKAKFQVGTETMLLDADSLQNLIGHLGALRSRLEPEVSTQPPELGSFLQVDEPTLHVSVSTDREIVGMLFRTPTCGWLGFSYLAAHARDIGEYLAREARPASPDPS